MCIVSLLGGLSLLKRVKIMMSLRIVGVSLAIFGLIVFMYIVRLSNNRKHIPSTLYLLLVICTILGVIISILTSNMLH